MKRFTAGLLNRSKSQEETVQHVTSPDSDYASGVRLFCESGSPTSQGQGEEVLHLPTIVETAESSPQAAAAAAYQIRKFLSKDYYKRSYVQYNAIMLIRILAENPGPIFTRNFDTKFVQTVRSLLQNGRDPSVQQIMRETLDALEAEHGYDEGLHPLLTMWRQTKGHASRISQPGAQPPTATHVRFGVPPYDANAPPIPPSQQQAAQRNFTRTQLPTPAELATRVEEARNTGKILLQLVQSTPSEEVPGNELIGEFSERCQAAQRSMQGFINCDSPAPDDDTLQTLIEVNEQLSLAMSRHQRAVLSGRRALGASPSPTPDSAQDVYGGYGGGGGLAAAATNSAFAAPPHPNVAANPYASGAAPVLSSFDDAAIAPPPGAPPALTARLQARSAGPHGYTPATLSPPQAPHPRPAEPAQNPFVNVSADEEDDGYDYDDYAGTPPRQPVAAPGQQAQFPRKQVSSPPRPGPTAYYNGGTTESYVHRQMSAANGLTMHGAFGAEEVGGARTEERSADVSPVEDGGRGNRYRY